MVQHLDYLNETASQTAGPFVHIGLAPHLAGLELEGPQLGSVIATKDTPGDHIAVTGKVIDGAGEAIKDVMIEVWQADADGQYKTDPSPADGFRGWGRCAPDFETGLFRIETIKPGPVMLQDGRRMAPHLSLWLVARGINTGLHTRLYFADEDVANASDPVLSLIEQQSRRDTLIAATNDNGQYSFDIVLQGNGETVFFDV